MKTYRSLVLALAAGITLLALACSSGDNSGIRVSSGLSAVPPSSPSASGSMGSTASGSSTTQRDAAVAPDISKSNIVNSYALPVPYLQGSPQGLSAQGYGLASAPADRAIVYFYVSANYIGIPKPVPSIGCIPAPENVCPTVAPEPSPITRETIQPLIDALKRSGIAESDIEINVHPYNASVSALVRDIGKTDAAVSAVRSAASGHNEFVLNEINVAYALSDCAPVERHATVAATQDARARAKALAEVLGVETGKVTGASQQFFGGYGLSGCSNDGPRIMEYAAASALPYGPGQGREVQVSAVVALTIEIK